MKFLSLFEGFGIELEYMLVDRESLAIRPISDQVMKSVAGELVSDFVDGDITWSNELVLHVIELKTSGPAPSLNHLEDSFFRSISRLANAAGEFNARLMPTAMHPMMNPTREMKLWPHDNNEIYEAYDRIFNCKGHGWSNLTSMHINYPFQTDDEFERLHTAIRFLLPILPGLTASSPMVEGRLTGSLDNRLLFYQENQKRIPSITGLVIPEYAKSMTDYQQIILQRVYSDIAPHDPGELMREDWLNSRGAIARFERQTIEIRVLDLQESPALDLAIADLITATLKQLTIGGLVPRETQRGFSTESLKKIFDSSVKNAERSELSDPSYLKAWGINADARSTGEIWRKIFSDSTVANLMSPQHAQSVQKILDRGSLATRITSALGPGPSEEKVKRVYEKVCTCLDQNKFFEPSL